MSEAVSNYIVFTLKHKQEMMAMHTSRNATTVHDGTLTGDCSSEDKALINWCNWFLHSKGLKIDRLGELVDGTFLITILEELTGLESYDSRSRSSSGGSLRHRNWATIFDVLGLDEFAITSK